MPITGLDHVVCTVSDLEAAVDFYTRIPGVEHVTYGDDRHALQCGAQKINLHEAGDPVDPRAPEAEPGDTDLCLLTDAPADELHAEVEDAGLDVELGPVERTGALSDERGKLTSVYLRDPDGSLIEVATYGEGASYE